MKDESNSGEPVNSAGQGENLVAATASDQASGKPGRSSWRQSRRPKTGALTPDQMKRQGDITSFALAQLGSAAEAISFLNAFNPSLEGRPLDVAIASASGLASVRAHIAAMEGDGVRG